MLPNVPYTNCTRGDQITLFAYFFNTISSGGETNLFYLISFSSSALTLALRIFAIQYTVIHSSSYIEFNSAARNL